MLFLLVLLGIFSLSNATALISDYIFYPEVNISYKFHFDQEPWYEARKICMQEGAKLAMPRNSKEAEIINNISKSDATPVLRPNARSIHLDYVYLGFHDIFKENEYITLMGEPINNYFHIWAPTQPDNSNNEDCGSLHIPSGGINDFQCGHNGWVAAFVCQKDQSIVLETKSSLEIVTECAEEFLEMYKLHLTHKTWPDARATCYNEGGHLAIIKSKEESNNILNQITSLHDNELAYIGIHDYYEEGHFVSVLDENLDDLKTHWADKQPDGGIKENCLSIDKNGKLHDVQCNDTLAFICEKVDNSNEIFDYSIVV